MCEKQKLLDWLTSLNITRHTDAWDLGSLISDAPFKVFSTEGASKLCLVFKEEDFVIKWSNDDRYDESIKEVELYQKAKEKNLEKFFPKTEIFAEINGITFILQEKISFSCAVLPGHKSRKYRDMTKTSSDKVVSKMAHEFKAAAPRYKRNLNTLWAKMALVLYGKKACKALCDFIVENHINDLHEDNIGYKNDRPVILDFAGYHRNDY